MKTKILILLLAFAFTAQSCGLAPSNRGKKIDLTWWKPFDTKEMVQPLVETFQKANPNVRINYVQKNIENYEDELRDALAEGEGPDIFSIHNDWLPKHKAKLAPDPDNIFSAREFKENFLEVANADLAEDGKVYAAPLGMDVLALYYNKDILSYAGMPRPPASWQELIDMVPRLTRLDNLGNFQRNAVALGTAENINRAPDILGLLMLQNGTPLYSSNRDSATLDQQIQDPQGNYYSPGARALEFYTQFANPAKLTYTWNNRSNNSIEAFAGGQVAMIFSYSYLRATLESKSPFLNYGVAPMPQIDPKQSRVNYANYWAEAVAKGSKHQEAAWQFLKFISGKDILPKYYEAQKQVSPRLDILEQQISDSEIGVFAENALSAKSLYKPDSDVVESIFVQMIDNVVLHSVAPQEAIKDATQKLNVLLRGN